MASFLIRQFARRTFTRTATPIVQRQITPNEKEKTINDDPLEHEDYFNVRSMVNLETLFKWGEEVLNEQRERDEVIVLEIVPIMVMWQEWETRGCRNTSMVID